VVHGYLLHLAAAKYSASVLGGVRAMFGTFSVWLNFPRPVDETASYIIDGVRRKTRAPPPKLRVLQFPLEAMIK
jgi:hypothetical protein